MDRRRPPDRLSAASPPPHPPPSTPSHLLRDVSNFKTPRPFSTNPNPNPNPSPSPLFYTASKKTPYFPSSSKTTRRLKALELEQSRSARKIHLRRERKLERFASSLTAWLNFLFQNPNCCGCDVRSCADDGVVGIGRKGRSDAGDGIGLSLGKEMGLLKKSLDKICSLEDVRERMGGCLSSKGCDEVLSMMKRVCKVRSKFGLFCDFVWWRSSSTWWR